MGERKPSPLEKLLDDIDKHSSEDTDTANVAITHMTLMHIDDGLKDLAISLGDRPRAVAYAIAVRSNSILGEVAGLLRTSPESFLSRQIMPTNSSNVDPASWGVSSACIAHPKSVFAMNSIATMEKDTLSRLVFTMLGRTSHMLRLNAAFRGISLQAVTQHSMVNDECSRGVW